VTGQDLRKLRVARSNPITPIPVVDGYFSRWALRCITLVHFNAAGGASGSIADPVRATAQIVLNRLEVL